MGGFTMSKIVTDKDFYRQMLMIALPIALQNVITFAVGMMDTVMLGSLGEVAISASSLANQLSFILMIIMFGVSSGSSVLISQYWGKGDVVAIRKVMVIMYRVVLVISLFFTFIALVMPGQFLSIFTKDVQVIEQGISYMKIVMLSYVIFAITNVTLNTLRAVRTVNISIVVYSVSLVVNTFFNWVFIYGNLGAPKLGIRGAAIGTIIARLTEFAIVVFYMLRIDQKLKLRLSHLLKIDRSMIRDYASAAVPVVCNEFLWSMGASMLSVVVGRMGTEFVTANSINNVVMQLVMVMMFGVSSAASVIVGNTIGANEYHKLKDVTRTLELLAHATGIIAAILMIVLRPVVLSIYNVSDLTREYTYQIMAVTAVLSLFRAPQSVTMMGILRGGGDTKFVLFADIFFMWVLAVPLGFFTAFVLHWPVPAVYFVLKMDEPLKYLLGMWRLHSGKWVKNVTRDDIDTLDSADELSL